MLNSLGFDMVSINQSIHNIYMDIQVKIDKSRLSYRFRCTCQCSPHVCSLSYMIVRLAIRMFNYSIRMIQTQIRFLYWKFQSAGESAHWKNYMNCTIIYYRREVMTKNVHCAMMSKCHRLKVLSCGNSSDSILNRESYFIMLSRKYCVIGTMIFLLDS